MRDTLRNLDRQPPGISGFVSCRCRTDAASCLRRNNSSSLTLERSQKFEEDFAKIVGSATPLDGKIAVDLPEIAENGNFVPITIAVDSPMTDADHVKRSTFSRPPIPSRTSQRSACRR